MSSTNQSKRFFSPVIALIAAALLAIGLIIGAVYVSEAINQHVISIKGFGLAGVLTLAGAALFFAAFPKGCRACRKRFTDHRAYFAPGEYDRIAAAAHGTDPASIRELAAIPSAKDHRAGLMLSYCEGCRRVGEIRVIEERNNGQFDEVVRGTSYSPLSQEMLEAALEVINGRKAL